LKGGGINTFPVSKFWGSSANYDEKEKYYG